MAATINQSSVSRRSAMAYETAGASGQAGVPPGLDAHAGQLRPESGNGATAHAEGGQEDVGEPARALASDGFPIVFVRRDLNVFAHVHPSGSAPMAAMDMAMPPDGWHESHEVPPPVDRVVSLRISPAGSYRIFVQVKRAGRVVTEVFDADVK